MFLLDSLALVRNFHQDFAGGVTFQSDLDRTAPVTIFYCVVNKVVKDLLNPAGISFYKCRLMLSRLYAERKYYGSSL